MKYIILTFISFYESEEKPARSRYEVCLDYSSILHIEA
jgi:hypothetical protein